MYCTVLYHERRSRDACSASFVQRRATGRSCTVTADRNTAQYCTIRDSKGNSRGVGSQTLAVASAVARASTQSFGEQPWSPMHMAKRRGELFADHAALRENYGSQCMQIKQQLRGSTDHQNYGWAAVLV